MNILLFALIIVLLILVIKRESLVPVRMYSTGPVPAFSSFDDTPASTLAQGVAYNPPGPEAINGIANSLSYWNPYPTPLLESGAVREPQPQPTLAWEQRKLGEESSPY